MELDECPREARSDRPGERRLAGARRPEQQHGRRGPEPEPVGELSVGQRGNHPPVQNLFGRREPLHGLPQSVHGHIPAEAFNERELLGHHRGVPGVEVETFEVGESLVDEGILADLAGLDERQQAAGAPGDALLIEASQQGRSDALAPPVRVEGEGEEMRVRTAHPGHHCAHQLAARRDRHDGGLVLMQRFHDVAASIGGTGGDAGHVDERHDVIDRGHGVTVAQGVDLPTGGQESVLLVRRTRIVGEDTRACWLTRCSNGR